MYEECYPNNCLPCSETFTKLRLRLPESGSSSRSTDIIGTPRNVRNAQLEDKVLEVIVELPETNTEKISQRVNVSYKTVWNILKENLVHPYHIQHLEDLLPNDYFLHMQCCQ